MIEKDTFADKVLDKNCRFNMDLFMQPTQPLVPLWLTRWNSRLNETYTEG